MPNPLPSYEGSPPKVQPFVFDDFTGGFNSVDDHYRLKPQETSDAVNVDFGVRGGFRSRSGARPFPVPADETLYGDPTNGTEQMTEFSVAPDWNSQTNGFAFQAADGRVDFYSWGGTLLEQSDYAPWTLVTTDQHKARPTQVVQFQNCAYLSSTRLYKDGDANVRGYVRRWNGTSLDDLTKAGVAWQEDYGNPDDGHFPVASTLAVHQGRVWAGGTYDFDGEGAATWHPSRIRFSHPLSAENWRLNDYLEIDPGAPFDLITAMVSFGDYLLVFRRTSMYAVMGYDEDTFQIVQLSGSVGTLSPKSLIRTPYGLFFTAADGKVYLHSELAPPKLMSEQIAPWVKDNIQLTPETVSVAWDGTKLWVSYPHTFTVATMTWADVPGGYTFDHSWADRPWLPVGEQRSHDAPGAVFVWDSRVNSWARYSYPHALTAMLFSAVPDAPKLMMGCFLMFAKSIDGVDVAEIADGGVRALCLLGDEAFAFDKFCGGSSETIGGQVYDGLVPAAAIPAHYRTSWVFYGNPSQRKRFRRFDVVARDGSESTVLVDVFHDFNTSEVKRQGQITLDGDGDMRDSEVKRSLAPGGARAVQLRFTTPTPVTPEGGKRWGIDSIVFKAVPKAVR